MSSQTQSSVDVDEDTWESLKDTMASFIRKEMEKFLDEMRICMRPTRIEFPRFGGDDVKGWSFKSAHYFQVNNIPDESKDMAWVIYKDLILKRFGNVQTAKFSCNSVMDSSLTLHLDDEEVYVIPPVLVGS
nr:hypothetical protein [Tanacetum cinerariifolium]